MSQTDSDYDDDVSTNKRALCEALLRNSWVNIYMENIIDGMDAEMSYNKVVESAKKAIPVMKSDKCKQVD